jgi:hypothetical protein
MNPKLKRLLIACHPDRHGGDHSFMEQFFAALRRRSNRKGSNNRCPTCGVVIDAMANHCRLHWKKKNQLTALFLLLALPCYAQKGATLLMTPSKLINTVPQSSLVTLPPAGETVTLAWDASPDADVAGYSVYMATNKPDWKLLGTTLGLSMTVSNLTLPTSFMVTAKTAKGDESKPSNILDVLGKDSVNEISYETPPTLINAVWTDRGVFFRGTNQTGMGFYRLKIANTNLWRTVSTP